MGGPGQRGEGDGVRNCFLLYSRCDRDHSEKLSLHPTKGRPWTTKAENNEGCQCSLESNFSHAYFFFHCKASSLPHHFPSANLCFRPITAMQVNTFVGFASNPFESMPPDLAHHFFSEYCGIATEDGFDDTPIPVTLIALQFVNTRFLRFIRDEKFLTGKALLNFRWQHRCDRKQSQILLESVRKYGSVSLLKWLHDDLKYPIFNNCAHEAALGKIFERSVTITNLLFYLSRRAYGHISMAERTPLCFASDRYERRPCRQWQSRGDQMGGDCPSTPLRI